jgi:hypothetical protein
MPTSPRNYNKNKDQRGKSQDVFVRAKNMAFEKDIDNARKEKMKLWVTFYRRNIHRFVEDYFGIKLFPYQILWLYMMSVSETFVAICSRAAAKSFLVAVFATARAILYPGSEIVIGASTMKQAGLIVSEKMAQLRNNSPNLQREITNLVANMNTYEAIFANGSKVKVVAANEGARGNRATTLKILAHAPAMVI